MADGGHVGHALVAVHDTVGQARMRARSASGTPMSSEITSIGSLPAKSST